MSSENLELVMAGLLRRLARMQQMLIISRILNETLDLNTLLRYIIETATDLTQTEAASILLVEPKSGQLRFAASTNIPRAELSELPVPLEKSIAGWILVTGRSMMISDVQRAPLFYEGVDRQTSFHTRSIMGVPLEVKGRKIGVIEVVNKRGNAPFTEDDLEVLTILGAQAAVSIENARLFEQSDTIYDVVHELRTPLTSIIGYSKMLLIADSLPDETKRQFANTIHREASRLGDMVNNYLDLARLESGRSRLNRQEVDIDSLITDAVHLIQPQATERGIHISIQTSEIPCKALVDPERIRQVLVNLLSNAIKYNTENGQIIVTTRKIDNSVCIAITDTGQGIEPDQLSHIFDKFYRGPEREGQVKGTGLGLSIAKAIIEMHKGTIEVTSIPGQGSTFTVTLPVHAAGAPA